MMHETQNHVVRPSTTCPSCGKVGKLPAGMQGWPKSCGARPARRPSTPRMPSRMRSIWLLSRQGFVPRRITQFGCPHCGLRLQESGRAVGSVARCQKCRHKIVVPNVSQPIVEDAWRKVKDAVFGESTAATGATLKPHRGIIVFTMGILSVFLFFVGFGWVFGLIAWALGSRDLKAMRNGEMDSGGEGLTHAGWLCGGAIGPVPRISAEIARSFGPRGPSVPMTTGCKA